MNIGLSLIICIVGALVYIIGYFAGERLPGCFMELGRLAFVAGLFALLFGH